MTDYPDLISKKVLIIGGSSGLGAAIAKQAQAAGAELVIFDVRPSEIPIYEFVDLTLDNSVTEAAERLDSGFDILISCAGLPPGENPAAILQVNYIGQTQFIQKLLVQAKDRARVISIASVGGREWQRYGETIMQLQTLRNLEEAERFCQANGIDSKSAYRLSKAGLITWTRMMTAHYSENEITFLAVSPGPVNTPLFRRAAQASPEATSMLTAHAPHVAEPDEIAHAILGLCRPEFNWLNGINIPLDGGLDARLDAHGLNMNIMLNAHNEER